MTGAHEPERDAAVTMGGVDPPCFEQFVPDAPGSVRARLFGRLPEWHQEAYWNCLRATVERERAEDRER